MLSIIGKGAVKRWCGVGSGSWGLGVAQKRIDGIATSLARSLSTNVEEGSSSSRGSSLSEAMLSMKLDEDKESSVRSKRKLKIPTKRAASLLMKLNHEQMQKATLDIPAFVAGDAIEVEYLLNKTSNKVQKAKGVVIARRNRELGSSFTIRNHIATVGFEQTFHLYSPLLVGIKVIKPRFIHRGIKRVRKSKLYYLRDKNPSFTTV